MNGNGFDWNEHSIYEDTHTCYIGLFMLRVVGKQWTKTSRHWLASVYYCSPHAQGQYNELIGFSDVSHVSPDDAKRLIENRVMDIVKTFPSEATYNAETKNENKEK